MYSHFIALIFFLNLLFPLFSAKIISIGDSIQSTIEAYPQESVFVLKKGDYSGNIHIQRSLELRGQGTETRILSSGTGNTVTITSHSTYLHSLNIEGSGDRHDQYDAGIFIAADKLKETKVIKVEDVLITGAVYGIVVKSSHNVKLIGNTIQGNPNIPFGFRGDGIRLSDSHSSLIISNKLINTRDLLAWNTTGNTFKYNQVIYGRYGIHFMYSDHNYLSHNVFLSNVVGSFIMYSDSIIVEKNLFAGSPGNGVGIKESDNIKVISNAIVDNMTGIYNDDAPTNDEDTNIFSHNLITLSDFGIEFGGRSRGSVFQSNSIVNNRTQVKTSRQATVEGVFWIRNHYDDYQGYDLNHDGVGDLPYRYRLLANDLTTKFPTLLFFDGTAVYYLINLIGKALPLIKPRIIINDPYPRINPYPLPTIQ